MLSTLVDLITLLLSGIGLLMRDRSDFLITLLAAFVIASLSWYLCNNYVKLWNKRFRLTLTHQILTLIASMLTFFFVLAFGGLKYMKEVTTFIVTVWEGFEIKADQSWSNATFKKAYYEVKDLKTEDFSRAPTPEQGGNTIPANGKTAKETAAKVYAVEACEHFDAEHPFLSKIIWSDPDQATTNITQDVIAYFDQNTGSVYTVDKAINIAADTIRTELDKQTPRTVTLSRIALVIFYLFVMAIPLGLIGYAAYKDIRIRK
jgi:hypothetical protein